MTTNTIVPKLTDHVRPFAFDRIDAKMRLRTESPRVIEKSLIEWNKLGWLDNNTVRELAAQMLPEGAPERSRILAQVEAQSGPKNLHRIHIDQQTSIDQTIALAGPIRSLDTRRNSLVRSLERYVLGWGSVAAGSVFVLGFTRGLNGSAFPLAFDLDETKSLPTRGEATPGPNVDSRIFRNGEVDRQRLVDRFFEISGGKSYYTRQDLKDNTDAPKILIKAAELCLLHEVAAQINRDGEKVMTLGAFIRFYEGSLFPEITRQRLDGYEAKTSKLASPRTIDIAAMQALFANAGGPEAQVVATQHNVSALALEDVIVPVAGGTKKLSSDGSGLSQTDLGVVNDKAPGKSIDLDATYKYWQSDKAVGTEALLRPIWWAVTGNRLGRTNNQDNRPSRPFAQPVEA